VILNCVSSSFFSSPSRPIDWLRFLVLSPFTTHACACVRKRKKKIRARTTHHHPAREDRQTDRRRNKRTIWEEEEETTRERRETIPIRRLELASGDEYQSYYERKVANNRRETRFARRRQEDVADLQTSHDVLTTLIVAAPIVLTAVLYCARLFSFAIHSGGRKND